MKKGFIVFAICALALSLCACSSSQNAKKEAPTASGNMQVINPIEQSTEKGIVELTGISLPAAQGASDVQYFAYRVNPLIAEMRFTLDGKSAYLRAQKTTLTAFPFEGLDLIERLQNGESVENGTDITGLHYPWKTFSTQDIAGMDAQCYRSDDVGYLAWIDTNAGILYNLCMTQGATDEVLMALAEAAYVPLQVNAK